MALIALLMGRRDKMPASTHIVQLQTSPDADDKDDILYIESLKDGRVRLHRTGLMLALEETINLVFTIQEDHCSIVEKKGIKRRGVQGEAVSGEVIVKCLRFGYNYRIRYESQITSTWVSFSFDTTSSKPISVKLSY